MKTSSYVSSVRNALPAGDRHLFDRALGGDALAARRLMVVAPFRTRGHIACLAYMLKTANPAYREILQAAWAPRTRHLIIDFWPNPMIRRMFMRANFTIPKFAGPLTVYQSACGISARKAAARICWTLSLEQVARQEGRRPAKVLRAMIEASDVIYWGNSRGEQEIISRRPMKGFVVLPAASAPLKSVSAIEGNTTVNLAALAV